MLPDKGTAWPPKEMESIFNKLNEWSAWYSGSPAELSAFYGSGSTVVRERPSDRHGGLSGLLGRLWWGKPKTQQGTDDRIHVPLPSDIAQAGGDLLFAEPPTITGPKRIGDFEDDLITTLLQGAESCAALGWVFLRPTWDETVSSAPFLSIIDADGAIPEFRYGKLSAATLWWVLSSRNSVIVRHLERHELDAEGNGIIIHGLYQGTSDNLGNPIDLTAHPETAGLADVVDENGSIFTGPGLCIIHVNNRMPNSLWRKGIGRYLGTSDFSKCEPLFNKLDEVTYDGHRELKKSNGRIVVPDYMLETNGEGSGSFFDMDRDVFTPLAAAPNAEGTFTIQAVQFSFDPQKYLTMAQELVEMILRRAGYSAQTFGEDENGNAATATEVNSRDRRTAGTRDRKIRHWRPAVEELIKKMLVIDNLVFRTPLESTEVVVTFSDSAQSTPLDLANTVKVLHDASAASTYERVRRVNPDWDKKQIEDEVKAINEEAGVGAAADPFTTGTVPPTAGDVPTEGSQLPSPDALPPNDQNVPVT